MYAPMSDYHSSKQPLLPDIFDQPLRCCTSYLCSLAICRGSRKSCRYNAGGTRARSCHSRDADTTTNCRSLRPVRELAKSSELGYSRRARLR
ncbi:hypothetical protein GALMADRAFT_297792 [Galerina marginata CBS 339.88]|uniref:Uncharacterized protein n=1 Tax=Galerina marginata (strain CBS 339.88) TaxID=685588 RepID=A0A067TRD3_GALM3|nr:hypothetical protein GALMADRAFT_297792 [Galerina marginata CBS 339.88]